MEKEAISVFLLIVLPVINFLLGYNAGRVRGFSHGLRYASVTLALTMKVKQLAELKGEDFSKFTQEEIDRRIAKLLAEQKKADEPSIY